MGTPGYIETWRDLGSVAPQLQRSGSADGCQRPPCVVAQAEHCARTHSSQTSIMGSEVGSSGWGRKRGLAL